MIEKIPVLNYFEKNYFAFALVLSVKCYYRKTLYLVLKYQFYTF